jgi:uncharacterized membrane protein
MKRTSGQKAADAVAKFGGSWAFIFCLSTLILVWISLNVLALFSKIAFDPYPYILLNLFLSMMATIQVPFILMSQNRQEERDRTKAAHNYATTIKAELEIISLHDKMDLLKGKQWTEMLEIQEKQLKLLADLTERKTP